VTDLPTPAGEQLVALDLATPAGADADVVAAPDADLTPQGLASLALAHVRAAAQGAAATPPDAAPQTVDQLAPALPMSRGLVPGDSPGEHHVFCRLLHVGCPR
jgi:hypothetical protein